MRESPSPTSTPSTPSAEADHAWAMRFTSRANENFSVLSLLVPPVARPHFAAVYAFCRVADDLADETGADQVARDRSSRLLREFRSEFRRCCEENDPVPGPFEPIFRPLASTMRACGLPANPFHDLLDAFEQDQVVVRYRTWEQLLDYSRRSANPVGRLVLMILGHRPPEEMPANRELFLASDDLCTALQLINFWQDVRRDLIERDRIYLPLEEMPFGEAELRRWLNEPEGEEFGHGLRPLVDRTEGLFLRGARISRLLEPAEARLIGLFAAGGMAILAKVRALGGATLWRRPRLRAWEKAWLVVRAMVE